MANWFSSLKNNIEAHWGPKIGHPVQMDGMYHTITYVMDGTVRFKREGVAKRVITSANASDLVWTGNYWTMAGRE